MVVGSGRGDVVGSFFGEDLGEVGIFQWEQDFGFCLFSGDGEFRCHSEFSNERGVREESFTITAKDSVDLVIV